MILRHDWKGAKLMPCFKVGQNDEEVKLRDFGPPPVFIISSLPISDNCGVKASQTREFLIFGGCFRIMNKPLSTHPTIVTCGVLPSNPRAGKNL